MMAGTIWTKFFWQDWAADPALRMCSFAAQGLWMRVLCLAAEADPIGYVVVNGKPLDFSAIARAGRWHRAGGGFPDRRARPKRRPLPRSPRRDLQSPHGSRRQKDRTC